jgi:hypothetical protein
MSKGQQAMVYPEPENTTHGKRSKTKLLLETKTNFSGARLSQARTVLACSTDLALAVLAGSEPAKALGLALPPAEPLRILIRPKRATPRTTSPRCPPKRHNSGAVAARYRHGTVMLSADYRCAFWSAKA